MLYLNQNFEKLTAEEFSAAVRTAGKPDQIPAGNILLVAIAAFGPIAAGALLAFAKMTLEKILNR